MGLRPSAWWWVRPLARPGFALLASGSLLAGAHLWLARSVLVPLRRDHATEWILVSATFSTFLATVALAGAMVAVTHWWLRRSESRRGAQPGLFSGDDVAYARPLLWFGISLVPLANLLPWPGPLPPVLVFVIADLRWWWTAACLLWVAGRADRRLGGAWSAPIVAGCGRPMPRGAPELLLALLVMAWAFWSSPEIRFAAGHTGDEPKYLRYLEAFYQGVGVDISQVRPLVELPKDFRPRPFENLALAARVLPQELRDLAGDAAAFAKDPGARFNRARRMGGFVDGRYGGVFQIYNPGMSILMFPPYMLDRARPPHPPPAGRDQWPKRLTAVNTFLLLMFGAWSVLIYRVLVRAVESRWAAWITALLLTTTLPMAALPFQIYPEVTAGVFAMAAAGFILFPGTARAATACAYGVAAGFLPWFHVRFGLLSLVLGAAAVLLLRAERRRLAWFLSGFAVAWACLSLYMHRVTGSVLPTALWTAPGAETVMNVGGIIPASVAYLIDRDWGLFPHAPVLTLAVIGYWWMAQRRPAVAIMALAAFAAVLIPAASHTLHAASTTPMRLIGSVVPLGALPLAAVLARYGRRLAFRAFVGVLAVLSLDNALSYNLHLVRHGGVFVDTSLSGWKVNMLFPVDARAPWDESTANGTLFVLWLAVLIVPLAAAIVRRGRPLASWPLVSAPRVALGSAFALVLGGLTVSAAQGRPMHHRYRIPIDAAATRAAVRLDRNGHCAVCLSSHRGDLWTGAMLALLEAADPSVLDRPLPDRVTFGYDEWLAMPGRIREYYLEATGREPAPSDVGHFMYQWHHERTTWRKIRRRIYTQAGKEPPAR